jgi:hypothetical protein
MKSVNTVVIPEYSEQLVLESIRRARENLQAKENAEKATALDFYYNKNLDTHLEQWFPGESLSQVPMFPLRLVPRFARARMLLLKNEIKRYIGGEISEDYKDMTYRLNSTMREYGEIAWLLGTCHLRSKWNDRRQRVEYDILPFVKEYYVRGESEAFAYSYEVESHNNKRQFVFWSESRDGEKGLHFMYDQAGKMINIPGGDGTNPYDILPISRMHNHGDASDVTRASIHAGIAMTEIALGVRFSLGQPVISGVHEAQSQIRSGIDRAIILPEGASFNYVSPSGSIPAMIESIKAMLSITAQNHSLQIKWGDAGQIQSGIALAIQDVENLESRQSDIPLWREWEASRYEIDRKIIEVHTGKNLSEDYSVDYGEVNYPLSEKEELEVLRIKQEMGIIDQEDIIRHYNPDISDQELAEKLGTNEEAPKEPRSPLLDALRTPVA